MSLDEIIYRSYTLTPFWAIDPNHWQDLVSALDGENRAVLASYPFKWAFNDSQEALEFLEDIGAGDEGVRTDMVEQLVSGLPSFESLLSQGSVDWSKPEIENSPVYGYRMIPEWEPMAGAASIVARMRSQSSLIYGE